MKYLLDTCVLSECVKKSPNPLLSNWFNERDPKQLYVSSITVAELQKGIFKIQHSQVERYQKLQSWLKTIEHEFYSRILPIDDNVLHCWAKLCAHAELQGKKLAVMDSLIAATALESNLILVTRNVSDFEHTNVPLINPWQLS